MNSVFPFCIISGPSSHILVHFMAVLIKSPLALSGLRVYALTERNYIAGIVTAALSLAPVIISLVRLMMVSFSPFAERHADFIYVSNTCRPYRGTGLRLRFDRLFLVPCFHFAIRVSLEPILYRLQTSNLLLVVGNICHC